MHFDSSLVRRLCNNGLYKTVLFSDVDYHLDNCVVMPGDYWRRDERGVVRPNLTDIVPGGYKRYYETFFILLNGSMNKFLIMAQKRQVVFVRPVQ